MIDQDDSVLECACGTGIITEYISRKAKTVTATDFSDEMLKQTKKKCSSSRNLIVKKADIMNLNFPDNTFDKLVAANVIHLLDEPEKAIKELERVCKLKGKIIIANYIADEIKNKNKIYMMIIRKLGVGFKNQYDFRTYKELFEKCTFENSTFKLIDGEIPCVVACMEKRTYDLELTPIGCN